jgi:hypothetical protein
MPEISHFVAGAVVVGIAATVLLDLIAMARQRLFGTPLPDYSLVGRWVGHMHRGRFRHPAIGSAPPVRGEAVIGWTVHYLTGIGFAGVLLGIWGIQWWSAPTLAAALIVGVGSVAAPFLLMQPGMGAGFAASRTANPAAARLRSLATHTTFGMCLYVAAWMTRGLIVP